MRRGDGLVGLVEGASDAEWAAVQDVRVDHGGGHVAVAEELLDGPDVVAGLEEVGREAMSQGVTGGVFGDTGGQDGRVERALKNRFVDVVASEMPGRVVPVVAGRGEHPLPRPLALGAEIFFGEGGRELDEAGTLGEVLAVQPLDLDEMLAQGFPDLRRKQRESVFAALSVAHEDVPGTEVEVLDAELSTLEEA